MGRGISAAEKLHLREIWTSCGAKGQNCSRERADWSSQGSQGTDRVHVVSLMFKSHFTRSASGSSCMRCQCHRSATQFLICSLNAPVCVSSQPSSSRWWWRWLMRWSPAPLITYTPCLRWRGPRTPPLPRELWEIQPLKPLTTRACSQWRAAWGFWVITPTTPTSARSHRRTRPRCGLRLGKTKVQ